MVYICKKNFEKYVDISGKFIKFLGEIKQPIEKSYPENLDLNNWDDRVTKLKIDEENKFIIDWYNSIKGEAEFCKKNLEKMLELKKETGFGLISYEKIKTNNRGKVDLKEFVQYLRTCIDIYTDLFDKK